MWRQLRTQGVPIISSWIDDGEETSINFAEAWPRYLAEASRASNMLVYLEHGDILKGGLVEVGAALASGVEVVIIGDPSHQFRTLKDHPNVFLAQSIQDFLPNLM